MLFLGFIAKAFGIKGGVFIKLLDDKSEALRVHAVLTLKKPGGSFLELKIKEVIGRHNVIFYDIGDRNQALELKGLEVFIKKTEMPDLLVDEYYLSDLIGAKVFDKDQAFLGQAKGFSSNNAQDLLVVTNLDGHEAYVPFIEPFLIDVDLEKKHIILDAPKELFNI